MRASLPDLHTLPDIAEEDEDGKQEGGVEESPPPSPSGSSEDSWNESFYRRGSHGTYNTRRDSVDGILNALFDMAGPNFMEPYLQVVWRTAEDEERAEQAMMAHFRNPFE